MIQPVDEELEDIRSSVGQCDDFVFGFFEGTIQGSEEEGRVVDDTVQLHSEAFCLGSNNDLSHGRVRCSIEVSILGSTGTQI